MSRQRLRFRRRATALVIVLALFAAGCGVRPKARSPRVPVTVAEATRRAVPLALASTGTVEASQNADVGSQVGGVVTRVAFSEGQEVSEGQVLFELDPRPFRNALEVAQAALARDHAQAETARREAERSRVLFDQNVLSQAEWDQKRSAAEALTATVRADSAAVSLARLNLQYATIRAPIGGQTGRLMVHVGDLVKAATSDPLVRVVQVKPVRVRFTVPVTDVPLVQRFRSAHPRVTVTIPGGDSTAREGALVFIDNAVDEASGTLLLKGEFANRDAALVPGQFVDVRLVLDEQRDRLVVPNLAISRGQEGAFVYVLQPDSTVLTRPVTVDRAVDDVTIVSAGLEPGERVVTDGQLRLSPGARVLVRSNEAPRAVRTGDGGGGGGRRGATPAGARGRKP